MKLLMSLQEGLTDSKTQLNPCWEGSQVPAGLRCGRLNKKRMRRGRKEVKARGECVNLSLANPEKVDTFHVGGCFFPPLHARNSGQIYSGRAGIRPIEVRAVLCANCDTACWGSDREADWGNEINFMCAERRNLVWNHVKLHWCGSRQLCADSELSRTHALTHTHPHTHEHTL